MGQQMTTQGYILLHSISCQNFGPWSNCQQADGREKGMK